MNQVEELEKQLAELVVVRDRSVGLTLKRTNFRIATLQSRIRNLEKGR